MKRLKEHGGQGIWRVDGDDVQGDWQWDQPEEESPSKREEVNITGKDGYETPKRLRIFAHFMPEIFAVDADLTGDSVAGELLKPKSSEPKPGQRLAEELFQLDCCDDEVVHRGMPPEWTRSCEFKGQLCQE